MHVLRDRRRIGVEMADRAAKSRWVGDGSYLMMAHEIVTPCTRASLTIVLCTAMICEHGSLSRSFGSQVLARSIASASRSALRCRRPCSRLVGYAASPEPSASVFHRQSLERRFSGRRQATITTVIYVPVDPPCVLATNRGGCPPSPKCRNIRGARRRTVGKAAQAARHFLCHGPGRCGSGSASCLFLEQVQFSTNRRVVFLISFAAIRVRAPMQHLV